MISKLSWPAEMVFESTPSVEVVKSALFLMEPIFCGLSETVSMFVIFLKLSAIALRCF